MADQGVVKITMTAPASTARGTMLSGAGTKSATLRAVGVLADSTEATDTTGIVQIGGTALCLAGAAFVIGARLKANATGKLITATGDATDNSLICAVALEAAAGASELRSVKLL